MKGSEALKGSEKEIDAMLESLRSRAHRNNKLYPEESYLLAQRINRNQVDNFAGVIIGGRDWFEIPKVIDQIEKDLKRANLVLGFYGGMPSEDVARIFQGILRRVRAALQLNENQFDPKQQIPSIYPTAEGVGGIRSGLEMAHHFFQLAKDEQVELRNRGNANFIFHSLGIVPDLPENRYCIPAGGGWRSIPAFIPDPRPEPPIPGRYMSAIRVFRMRHELDIRVVPVSESKPPMNIAEEAAREVQKEADDHAEIDRLVAVIAGD